MLDNFRKIDITWDKANKKIYELIRTASSDENGRKLVVQVLDNGQTVDLAGTELRLYWETKNKHYVGYDRFDLTDTKKGIYELAFSTGMLSNIGKLKANLHLMNPVGETIIVTSETFNIEVFQGIDNKSIEASNSFTALTNSLVRLTRIEEQEEERKENETARKQAESARVTAENTRKSAENTRESAELDRKSNESGRIAFHNDMQNKLQLGYFKGAKGDKGDKGEKGDQGEVSLSQLNATINPIKTKTDTFTTLGNQVNFEETPVVNGKQLLWFGTVEEI